MRISFMRRDEQVSWSDVTAAGLVGLPDANEGDEVPEDLLTEILPGMDRLLDLNRSLSQDHRQLVLARGRSSRKAFRVPILIEDPGALALVEDVQRHLGDRWRGELPMERHERALDMANPWWFYPIIVVGLVAFAYMTCLAAGAFMSLSDGDIAQVPPVVWIALLLWVLLIGGILILYRGYRRRK